MSMEADSVPLFLPTFNDKEEKPLRRSTRGYASATDSEGDISEPVSTTSRASGKKASDFPPSSPGTESYVPSDEEDSPIKPKARRYASNNSSQIAPGSQKQALKKRKAEVELEQEPEIEPPWPKRSSYFLGSIIVANAWSTARGTGYVKNGDLIRVEREILRPTVGKGKQQTLSSMMKVPGAPKEKGNHIVRLLNERGFEFGRLPTEVSAWISKLLDMGIIIFEGCRMLDCPDKLYTGADLVVLVSLHILPSAFKRYKPEAKDTAFQKSSYFDKEGVETEEEKILRTRKISLQNLFKRLDLKPRQNEPSPSFTPEEKVPSSSAPRASQIVCSGSKNGHDHDDHGHDSDEEDGEVLSNGDLQVIYRRAQAQDASMEEMDPVDTFAFKLRPYQKQALFWMYSREIGSAAARDSHCLHPLWSEYTFPTEPKDGVIDISEEGQPFYYNSHSGELCLEFPRADNVCRGGILADVGMGKTIMVSSVIQTNRGEKIEEQIPDAPERALQNAKPKQLKLDSAFKPTVARSSCRTRSTLIVTPASLMDQWASELQRSSKEGTVNVIVWHGTSRDDLQSMIDCDVDAIDVVITSYGTLASEHAQYEKSSRNNGSIFDIEWYRIVLDEAHNIKSRTSKSSKACFDLQSPRRWALTGTPIVNRLEDLYSLLRFVNFSPWSNFSFFRSIVTLPFLNREPKAIEVVQVILESILLRREKNMKDRDGKSIVQLPDKIIKYEMLSFGALERKIYDGLYKHAKDKFNSLARQGIIGKRYTQIFALLMKLRRAVLHPSLVKESEDDEEMDPLATQEANISINHIIKQFAEREEEGGTGNEAYAQSVLSNLKTTGAEECPICMDVMEEPMLLPSCAHLCCKDCILAFIHDREEKDEEGVCPTCRSGPIKPSDLLEVVKRKKKEPIETDVGIAPEEDEDEVMHEPPPSSPAFELRKNDFKSSTKLNALIAHLRKLRDQDPCFRAIVFSQFTSFLDLIEVVMQRENLTWYRLDGATAVRKRHTAIEQFNIPSREPKVFLISLKAGGVGLNLTSANHVLMMDCWWNAAIENQAIDRVHRIGQERTVFVTHFIVSGTIEGRILKIQQRKTAIVKEAFKGEKDSDSLENLKIMFDEEEGDD